MTTPTANPVPSNSPLDLLFNAEKLDEVVNATTPQYIDRFGVARLTAQGATDTIKAFTNRGTWVTGTAYASKDLVQVSGTWYVAVVAHTAAAAFATDSAKWRVYQGVTAEELAAPNGASLVGYMPGGAGAVGTDVQSKLRENVTLEDFGGVGDGATNESAALAAAQASLPNGGVIRGLNGKQYYFQSGFTLNKGISFIGAWVTREDVGVFNPIGSASAILIDGTGTITVGNGAECSQWLVWRKGLTAATSAIDAAAKVAAFTGTAFTVGGADAKIRRNTIIGFNKVAASANYERAIIEDNHFDCTNGIDVSLSYDITHVRRNHGWPFFTVHQTWTTGPLLQRAGTAYKVYNVADFIHVESNFCYGYMTGYYLSDLAAGTVLANKADNVFASATGRIGFETRGAMNNVTFDNNHADSNEVNYRFAHTSGAVLGGVNTSGQSAGPSIQCGAGSRGLMGRFSLAGTCQYCIAFVSGVGKWRIDSMMIGSAPSGGQIYLIAPADVPNVQIGWTTRYNIAAADTLGYGSVSNPAIRVSHESTSGLAETLADGSMVMAVKGKPAQVWQPKTNGVNYLTTMAGATGERVTVAAEGEANVSIGIIPKGLGVIQLGASYTAAAVSQTGYVTMYDASGTPRKFLIG